MTSNRNIVLVGFMGTGKTRVGQCLAARLGMMFFDMDELIEQRAGKTVSRVFAEDGEPHFRSQERDLVRELSIRDGLVIATGGGIVLNPDNVRDFGRDGLLVCLSATPEAIFARVAREKHRPLIENGDKMRGIRERLESRRKLYEAIPHQIDTTNLTVEEVADRVAALYADWQCSHEP